MYAQTFLLNFKKALERKTEKKKEMEKLENKLNEMEALNMK